MTHHITLATSHHNTSHYPTNGLIKDTKMGKQSVPSYLQYFMEKLIKNELKQISLAQCIVNAIKTRSSIAPIMFGLGIEVEKVFGSKWLIIELNKLGFSISSTETTLCKQSVVFNENISDYLKDVMSGSFCQWSADNVDHNISWKRLLACYGNNCIKYKQFF